MNATLFEQARAKMYPRLLECARRLYWRNPQYIGTLGPLRVGAIDSSGDARDEAEVVLGARGDAVEETNQTLERYSFEYAYKCLAEDALGILYKRIRDAVDPIAEADRHHPEFLILEALRIDQSKSREVPTDFTREEVVDQFPNLLDQQARLDPEKLRKSRALLQELRGWLSHDEKKRLAAHIARQNPELGQQIAAHFGIAFHAAGQRKSTMAERADVYRMRTRLRERRIKFFLAVALTWMFILALGHQSGLINLDHQNEPALGTTNTMLAHQNEPALGIDDGLLAHQNEPGLDTPGVLLAHQNEPALGTTNALLAHQNEPALGTTDALLAHQNEPTLGTTNALLAHQNEPALGTTNALLAHQNEPEAWRLLA